MTDSARTADATPVSDRSRAAAVPPLPAKSPSAEIPPEASLPPSPALPPEAAMPPGLDRPAGLPSDNGEPTAEGVLDAALVESAQAAEIELGPPASAWDECRLQLPSMLTSTVFHLLLVLFLALLTSARIFPELGSDISVSTESAGGEGVENVDGDAMNIPSDLEASQALAPSQLSELPAEESISSVLGPISANLGSDPLLPRAAAGGMNLGDSEQIGGGGGNGLELRLDGANRAAMVRSGGGTPESERAVFKALAWLAEHQSYDGSWSFDHTGSPKCHGKCANPGSNASKIAATSLALLPFLGTGQTHREGEYQKTIDHGLKYLMRSMQSGREGSLWDPAGTMYGHGLASIVLCEAYGMTHDPTLQKAAQAAVNFIVYAQDPVGGGWRYQVQTPGDTSVVGWQLMALKSAQMAYLRVPPVTMRKAGYFLDYVQSDRGAVYGYQRPDNRRAATTAIGLLCRMYLGWGHDHDPLKRGVQVLSQFGPSIDTSGSKNNMYYNYYATQVMHHYGGYPWQRWNAVMREYLIRTQSDGGHEIGSWFLPGSDEGAHAGGRLYCTAMAAMTLEVYYRYMPLYRPQVTQAD